MISKSLLHSFILPSRYLRNIRFPIPLPVLSLLPVFLVLMPILRQGSAETLSEVTVMWVHDGDTITLKMGERTYRARLIGIDAPEMGQEPWGKKSRAYLRRLILEHKGRALLETDIVRFDKYDRLLVYLWSPDRRDMINERMLRDGYAVLFTIQPNSTYTGRFVKAQRYAKEYGAGIWAPEGLKELPREYKKNHPRL